MKKNKTVLITGSTSDIGRAIVYLYAKSGWDVICHYNSSLNNLKELRDMIRKEKVRGCFLKADFTSKKQLSEFVKKIKEFSITAFINNAGSYICSKHFTELALKDIEDVFMVNTFAPMLLAAQIFKQMKENSFGRIVNISSIAAKYGGSSCSMHYGCSKLALEGVTKTLAKEGAAFGILVNTIRPGVIDTEFHKKFPKDMAKRVAMIPLKKMGKPEDIAHMAYYLGSEENQYITNDIITIAGGE